MTVYLFLHHQWLNFWRSRNANKSVAIQMIVGIFYLLIFLEIAGLGISLPYLLKESFPDKDPIFLFCSYIIYYFLIGLIIRFQLQELPTLSIQPYLTQNIKRSKMLRFLNLRSIIHFINFLPLFVFIPFTVVDIVPAYGAVAAVLFLMAMFVLVINNHFLNMYIKRKSVNNSWWFFGMIFFIAVIKTLDYFKILSFEQTSAKLFIYLLQYPLLTVLPVMISALVFFVNNRYLRSHLYLEELESGRKIVSSKNYSFLNKYGEYGELIALDLKLIFRNKRAKSLIISSAFILLYGLLVYRDQKMSSYLLGGLFMTGMFIISYGQYLFAWQSSHFDGMMTYNINIKQFIKAKFTLMFTISFLQLLFATCYGFISWQILPIQVAAFLFNMGFNSFLAIYIATYNYKYLDLSKSARMNRQGSSGTQIVFGLLTFAVPILLFYLLNNFFGYWIAVITISLIGSTGLVLRGMIINWLAGQFYLRKHKILEGFRER